MKNFFKLLLFAEIVKILTTGASIGEAISILSLCSLNAFVLWLDNTKDEPLSEKVTLQLKQLEDEVISLKSGINSLKLASTLRR